MNRSVIDEIKERLDIVAVIGGYMTLQKSGRNFKALCPFHAEKTPSFYVFPDTGSWRCFGACGVGGDVIAFVQRRENLDLRDTLQLLAHRAGIELQERADPQTLNRLNRLREMNALAAAYFHHQLTQAPAGEIGRRYLERREINSETVAAFQLGYAPPGWDHVFNYLAARGYTQEEQETAGLVIRREDGGCYDRFRQRLMIPIRDVQGNVIGFGGRLLEEGEPKYLNTSQTPLFDKGSVIFALDAAKRALRNKDQVILVEGYMDVISAHQRGFKNVVAAMGTAITPAQLKRLGGYTRNFVFALDADAAGINATLRSIHVVREALAEPAVPVPTARGGIRYEQRLGAVIKIARMPPGQDPDDVLRRDPALWQQIIDNALPLLDYYMEQSAQSENLTTAHGKAQLVKTMIPLLYEVDNAVERKHYIGVLAMRAGVTDREIDHELDLYGRQLNQTRRRRTEEKQEQPQPAAVSGADEEPPLWGDAFAETLAPAPPALAPEPDQIWEAQILGHLLLRPDLLAPTDGELGQLRFDPLNTEDFQAASNRAIFDAQQEFLYSDAARSSVHFADTLDPALQPICRALMAQHDRLGELREEQRRKYVVDSVLRLRLLRLQKMSRQIEVLIQSAQADGEDDTDLRVHQARLASEQHLLDRALNARSHTGRWLKNGHRRFSPS